MPLAPGALDPESIALLEGLELRARSIVEGYVAGLHRSPYHGFSNEFAEHREYAPGDDLRYVDWKVYGKTDRVYLKQFDEETNYICNILVDASESMAYGSAAAPFSKWTYARIVAAALSLLVTRQQDAVGLAVVSDGIDEIVRPGSTAQHFSQICHTLEHAEPVGGTALAAVLHDLAERIRRKGLVVLISDLFDDPDQVLLGLKHLRRRGCDVLVLHVVDPAEHDFPFDDPTLFKGLEGLPEQFAEPRSLKTAYLQEFESFLQRLRVGVRNLQQDYLLLRTDQSFAQALAVYLNARRKRLGGG